MSWISTVPGEEAAAQRFLRAHRTLEALLRAGGAVVDIVVQDEFTHDVVARIPNGTDSLLVVFDST